MECHKFINLECFAQATEIPNKAHSLPAALANDRKKKETKQEQQQNKTIFCDIFFPTANMAVNQLKVASRLVS